MNAHLERVCRSAHVLRQIGFWLLAVEGVLLGILFLAPLGQALLTLPSLLQREDIDVKIAFTLFYLLAACSICATATQIGRKKWTAVPGMLHLWLLVGGGFLFFMVLNRGVAHGWEFADLVLLGSTILTIMMESFANITENLLAWWLQQRRRNAENH